MTVEEKARFHRGQQASSSMPYTQPYLDAAYEIVLDFRHSHYRVMHIQLPKDDDPAWVHVEAEFSSGEIYLIIISFPQEKYSEEACIQYLEKTGPEDIAGDFSQVKQPSLSTTLRGCFQYTMYSELLQDYGAFVTCWLTIDHIQFYHCWVSRSIGCYPSNIFLLPLDYYQAEVAHVFEDYFGEDLKPVNRINL